MVSKLIHLDVENVCLHLLENSKLQNNKSQSYFTQYCPDSNKFLIPLNSPPMISISTH